MAWSVCGGPGSGTRIYPGYKLVSKLTQFLWLLSALPTLLHKPIQVKGFPSPTSPSYITLPLDPCTPLDFSLLFSLLFLSHPFFSFPFPSLLFLSCSPLPTPLCSQSSVQSTTSFSCCGLFQVPLTIHPPCPQLNLPFSHTLKQPCPHFI